MRSEKLSELTAHIKTVSNKLCICYSKKKIHKIDMDFERHKVASTTLHNYTITNGLLVCWCGGGCFGFFVVVFLAIPGNSSRKHVNDNDNQKS